MLDLSNFERANVGKIKFRKTSEMIKDLEIDCLKLRYSFNILSVMDNLLELANFLKKFSD